MRDDNPDFGVEEGQPQFLWEDRNAKNADLNLYATNRPIDVSALQYRVAKLG